MTSQFELSDDTPVYVISVAAQLSGLHPQTLRASLDADIAFPLAGSNTIFDIDAMAQSVPYCDAVVTEKNACTTLLRAGLAERMHTVLLRRPSEILAWLEAL